MCCKMKNVAIINTCNWGSTGKIALSLHANLRERGYNVHFYYGRGEKSEDPSHHRIDTKFEIVLHVMMAGLTGLQGSFSRLATARLLSSLKKNQIDTIYIVSIQGYFINEKGLFDYVAKLNIRLVYTMIDAYSYSGACCTDPECDKVKTGKGKCPDIKKYPKSFFVDNCSKVLKRKIDGYTKMGNAVFVGPEYLVKCSQHSILGKYMKTIVLDEAIDLQLYQPYDASELRAKHRIDEKKIIILSVAPTSNPTRGARYFMEAARAYSNDERFVFIHIGNRLESTDNPSDFISIPFVEKDIDLAKYYSMADVLINPSITDAMSNTCLESLACGTPIVCFNMSGMPYLMDDTVGKLLPPRDVKAIVDTIERTQKKDKEVINTCRNYALKRYDNRSYADKLIQIAKGEFN